MTADLRRLAEQANQPEPGVAIVHFQRAANPQAILALLDAERDLRNERDEDRETMRGYVREIARKQHEVWTAERRVAALTEGLRALLAVSDGLVPVGDVVREARALLESSKEPASPSEPPDPTLCDCGHPASDHTDRGEQDAGLCLHRGELGAYNCACPEFIEREALGPVSEANDE